MAVRVVTRRVQNGRVAFNQVVMEQQPTPPGVLLVAIDADTGLYVWLRSHDTVAPHSIPQAPGYSRGLPPVVISAPPPFVGDPVFFPKDDVDGWDAIVGQPTHTLNREVRKLFGIAG